MSRSGQLFAVSADTAYEGREVVAVFDTESGAKAFVERCRKHDRRKPQPPFGIVDTAENNAAFSAWSKKCDRWRAKHPGKQMHQPDSWSVFPIRHFKD